MNKIEYSLLYSPVNAAPVLSRGGCQSAGNVTATRRHVALRKAPRAFYYYIYIYILYIQEQDFY